MEKYKERLVRNMELYEEKVKNEEFLISNENVTLVLNFKKHHFMHLVGFRYNESKNPANKFYDGLANGTIDWNKVYYSGKRYYTEQKLDAFTSFFASSKFGILENDGKIEISYEVTNGRNAILQIEKNKGNNNYFPKSFKSVNVSYLRDGDEVNIKKASR